MRKVLLLLLLGSLWVMLPAVQAQEAQTPQAICDAATPVENPTREFEAAEQVLQEGVDYGAVFCTGAGAVYIDLLEDLTPITVNNFVFLAQQGYYDNTNFHRVIEDFMAQGGDPTNTGTGGPGYSFQDEFVGFLSFDAPGWLAMANSGPNTNGSQFFITTVATPHLNQRHTIFGRVLEGQENVDAIELRDPAAASGDGTTLDAVVIVEDPSTVTLDYTPMTAATEEQVAAAFDGLSSPEILPEFFEVQRTEPVVLDTEAAVAALPEDQREAFAAFFATHNHDYRVDTLIRNTDCASLEGLPILQLGYTMDAFASAEDASAALADSFYAEQWAAQGFEERETTDLELDYPLYTQTVNDCETDLTYAVTQWQRGRFVVTASIQYVEIPDILPAEVLLRDTVGNGLFEPFLTNIYLPEVQ